MPHTVEIIYRSLVLFALLFFYTKALKKKHLAELKILDYMTSIVLGGIAAIHSSTIELSLISGVVSMTVWFIIAYLLQVLSYHYASINKLQGKQTVIIKDEKILQEKMKKEWYTPADLREDLRTKDISDPTHVEYAALEPSGRLNVLLKKDVRPVSEESLKNACLNNQQKKSFDKMTINAKEHPHFKMNFFLPDHFLND